MRAVRYAIKLSLPALQLRSKLLSFLIQSFQPVFLTIQLPGIALQERPFFRTALEHLHVAANAPLIFADLLFLFLQRSCLIVQLRDDILLRKNPAKCPLNPARMGCSTMIVRAEASPFRNVYVFFS